MRTPSQEKNMPTVGPGLSVDVEQGIQELIVDGTFVGGDRLIEDTLAQRLGVSRTPVREALHALAAHGLVERVTRGWTVRTLTLRDVREIYEIRAALEGAAARLAALRANGQQISDIAARHADSVKAIATRPPEAFTPASAAFHGAVVASADNQRLVDQIERARFVYFSRPIAALYTPDELRASSDEHSTILDAITSRDPDAAEQHMRDHIEHALTLVTTKLAWL
jgi:DNA-binding GntR family transcriptional regulator